MNKKLINIVLLLITVFYLVGCDRNLNSTLSIESSLYNVQEVVDDFKSSESKYAVEINQEENQWTQYIYIWNNELRRDLRNDLIQIVGQVDDSNNKIVSFKFGDKIVINNKVKVADVRLEKRFTFKSSNNVLLQISNQEYVVYGRPSDLDFEIRLNHQLVFRIFKHDTDKNNKRSIYIDDSFNSELMIAVMFAIILVDDYAEGNN